MATADNIAAMPFRRYFADQLRRRREDAGLSLNDLARLSGISSSTIAAWEHMRRYPFNWACLDLIAAVLDCSPRDLVGYHYFLEDTFSRLIAAELKTGKKITKRRADELRKRAAYLENSGLALTQL